MDDFGPAPDDIVPAGNRRARPAGSVAQLNAYLLRTAPEDLGSVLKDEAALRRLDIPLRHGISGRVYVGVSNAREPSWLAFLAELTGAEVTDHRNRHVSALALVVRGGRVFGLTFGYGRHFLRPAAIEHDFGLKVAANLVDAIHGVVSLESRAVQGVVVRTRRQADDGTTPGVMGFDPGVEMLRAVTGTPVREEDGDRVTGSDAVSVHAVVEAAGLGARLDRLLEAHASRAYQRGFSSLDDWQEERDAAVIEELDVQVADAVAAGSPAVRLSLPTVIDPEDIAGYRFTGEGRTIVHPVPNLADYVAVGHEIDPGTFKRHELRSIRAETEATGKSWPVYQCLHTEIERDEEVYVLADGRWYRISTEYRDRIDRYLDGIPVLRTDWPERLVPEDEAHYNSRLSRAIAGSAVLDLDLAGFEGEAGTVEICDVFTPSRQFIHVKDTESSKKLSHLFSQGAVSAELFAHDRAYRATIRRKLAGHPELSALIPEERPDAAAFEVVLALTRARPEDIPGGSRAGGVASLSLLDSHAQNLTPFKVTR